MSPELAGGFLTTVPPEKPSHLFLHSICCVDSSIRRKLRFTQVCSWKNGKLTGPWKGSQGPPGISRPRFENWCSSQHCLCPQHSQNGIEKKIMGTTNIAIIVPIWRMRKLRLRNTQCSAQVKQLLLLNKNTDKRTYTAKQILWLVVRLDQGMRWKWPF